MLAVVVLQTTSRATRADGAPNKRVEMPLHKSFELVEFGATRDTIADRGIVLGLVIAADQSRILNRRGQLSTRRTRPKLSDEPHRSARGPRTPETHGQRFDKP